MFSMFGNQNAALVIHARSFWKRLIRIRHALAMLGTDSMQPWRCWFFLLPWLRQIWETILSAASTSYLATVLKRIVWRMVNDARRFFKDLAFCGNGFLRAGWLFVGLAWLSGWRIPELESKSKFLRALGGFWRSSKILSGANRLAFSSRLLVGEGDFKVCRHDFVGSFALFPKFRIDFFEKHGILFTIEQRRKPRGKGSI